MDNNVVIPSQYKPVSPWAYIGYNLLFGLPLIGVIMIFVFAFNNENLNRRNYARSYLYLWAIVLGISIVVGIIVLIIALVAGGSMASSSGINLS